MKKVLSVMLLVALIVALGSNVFASDIIGQIETATDSATPDMSPIMGSVGNVIKTIRNASVIIGVIILIILGLKYMMGSVEEKSGYQKSFIPLIVGIIVVMSATTIASFLFGLF